jgi:hypothetical protein
LLVVGVSPEDDRPQKQSTKHKAPRTKHQEQSTKNKAQRTKHKEQAQRKRPAENSLAPGVGMKMAGGDCVVSCQVVA